MKVQDINSAAIRAFIEAGRDEADMIGIYDHPDHMGDNDWRITLYECGGRVAAGNGGAIFEEADPEQFANLMREYGIE